jgi:hypothetical protein
MSRTNDQRLSIPSKKVCEKKLREIRILKQKHTQEPLNTEEQTKVDRETYFQEIIRTEHEKVLERLPDEIQQLILSFLDHNTRLNVLGAKYLPNTVCHRLLCLPKTVYTINHLIGLVQRVTPIIQQLQGHKDGLQKEKARLYTKQLRRQILCECQTHYMSREQARAHYIRTLDNYSIQLAKTVEIALRHYHKMYTLSASVPSIRIRINENEHTMLKVYAHIASVL